MTQRQREVLVLMARGLCDKEIGALLGIGTRTVRTHIEHIFEEYACHSRAAAVATWLQADDGIGVLLSDGLSPTVAPATGVEWDRPGVELGEDDDRADATRT